MYKKLAFLCMLLALQGCMYAAIETQDLKAKVFTFTPTGNSTQFEGVLTGKGRVSLNREQGGAEGLMEEVGEAVRPLTGNSL
jgi:hypothetical protein